ncbi:MAG: methyltransferase domain-containing protein, partial [Myxococcota bacterium]
MTKTLKDTNTAFRAVHHQDIIGYYEEATRDYEVWSVQFHMHFGYFAPGARSREAMLQEMSRRVLARLNLHEVHGASVVLDMGCGLGATMRDGAEWYPRATFHGVTLVGWQARRAAEMNAEHPHGARLHIHEGEYTRTEFAQGMADGVIAIESACHASGADKADWVLEAARVLRSGGRVAVADAFRIRADRPLNWVQRRAYQVLRRNWALESFATLDAFTAALSRHGFKDVVVEDISARVAPSVMHVPWVTVKFLVQQWWRGERIEGWRW